MSQQLYARVFTQILDSSLADNWQARHIFEDLLKLADNGIVDMTRQAIARRTNVPMSVVDECITFLESPDPSSRDAEEEGRRLVRIDKHRDWGWRIVNWMKYESIRTSADQREKTAARVRKHRSKKTASASYTDTGRNAGALHSVTSPKKQFQIPTVEACIAMAEAMGMPASEGESFWNHYESNGWKVGRNPMKSMPAAMANWKKNFNAGTYSTRGNGKAPTLHDLKTVLKIKQDKAEALKRRHTIDVATGTQWTDHPKRQEYVTLRAEIKSLEAQLEAMVSPAP